MSRAVNTRVTRASTRKAREEPVSSDSEGTESADSEPRDSWSVVAVTGIEASKKDQVETKKVVTPVSIAERKSSEIDGGYNSQIPQVSGGDLREKVKTCPR